MSVSTSTSSLLTENSHLLQSQPHNNSHPQDLSASQQQQSESTRIDIAPEQISKSAAVPDSSSPTIALNPSTHTSDDTSHSNTDTTSSSSSTTTATATANMSSDPRNTDSKPVPKRSFLQNLASAIGSFVTIFVLYIGVNYLDSNSSSKYASSHLVITLHIIFGYNLLGWLLSSYFETDHLYDLCGTTSFMLAAAYTITQSHRALDWGSAVWWHQCVGVVLLYVWALRLFNLLVRRVFKYGEDRRFRVAKRNPWLFSQYWAGQVMWVLIVGMPVYLNNLHGEKSDKFATPLFMIGLFVWIFGFIVELVADAQKAEFKREQHDFKSKGKLQADGSVPGKKPWIDSGLWSISRHPNYAGEITVWIGMSLLVIDSLPSSQVKLIIACLLSPMLTALLLVCISGVPLLEQQADKDFGSRVDYQEYKRTTGVLLPTITCGKKAE